MITDIEQAEDMRKQHYAQRARAIRKELGINRPQPRPNVELPRWLKKKEG